MSKNLFITGTGTDVGKTYITGLIVKKLHENGLHAAYYKAAMSGNGRRPDGSLIPGDALHVKTVSGIEQPLAEMCPYIYEAAVSPHLAAKLEQMPVEMDRVLQGFDALASRYAYVTAEGSGGILCPLRFDGREIWLEDFITARGVGCLLVAHARPGTNKAGLLTEEYMKAHRIPLKGIIFNRYEPGNPMHEDNRRMCGQLAGLDVLACVKEGDTALDIPLAVLEALYGQERGTI